MTSMSLFKSFYYWSVIVIVMHTYQCVIYQIKPSYFTLAVITVLLLCLTTRGVESGTVELHALRWNRSRFFRYNRVGVEIFFATPTLILIILYVNCLKIKVNNLHQIAYILSHGVSVISFKSSTKQALRPNILSTPQPF